MICLHIGLVGNISWSILHAVKFFCRLCNEKYMLFLSDWLKAKGLNPSFEDFSNYDLAKVLEKFYAEVNSNSYDHYEIKMLPFCKIN